MKTLEVKNLTVAAKTATGISPIVNGLDFGVDKGETLAIVGESGCGKTMTALSIFGVLPANCFFNGEICLGGKNLALLSERELNELRGKNIVMVPQSGAEFLNPSLKIKTQLYECCKKEGVAPSRYAARSFRKLYAAGIAEPSQILEKYPFELSGGQAQRVCLAAAVSDSAQAVIADEPTKGVDNETANAFLDSLHNVLGNAATILITHDISVAKRADGVLVMLNGYAVEYGTAEQVLGEPKHPYTKSLLAALPENGMKASSADREPTAVCCPYYGRCEIATDKCKSGVPPMINTDDNREARCFYA